MEDCVETDCKHPDTRRKCCKFCGDFSTSPTLSVSVSHLTELSTATASTPLAYTRAPALEIVAGTCTTN